MYQQLVYVASWIEILRILIGRNYRCCVIYVAMLNSFFHFYNMLKEKSGLDLLSCQIRLRLNTLVESDKMGMVHDLFEVIGCIQEWKIDY